MYTEIPDHTNRVTKFLIAIWVVLALAVVYWVNPNFWMDSVDYFKRAQNAASRGNYQKAITEIDTAISMEPENTGYLVTKGFILMDSGSTAEAVQIFKNVLEIDPGNREARFGMADIMFESLKPQEAREWLMGIEFDATDSELLIRRARMLARIKQHQAALKDVNQLLAKHPNHPAALLESAKLHSALKDFDNAAASYNHLAEISQEDHIKREALNGLAVSLRAQGKAKLSYKVFKKIPHDDNLQARAELAMETGKTREAISLYEELMGKQGDSDSANRALGTLYEMTGKYKKAISYLEKSFAGSEMNAETLIRLGDLYRWTDNPQTALTLYQQSLERDPQDTAGKANFGLAAALVDLGKHKEALETLRTVLTARPGDPDVLATAARAATGSGDPEQAVTYLKQLSEKRDLNTQEKHWLAGQYHLAGDLDNSLVLYKELLAGTEKDPALREALGDLYWDREEFNKALDSWVAIPAEKRTGDLNLKIGRAAYRLQKNDLALQSLTPYLESNPRHIEAALTCADLYLQRGDHDSVSEIIKTILPEINKNLKAHPKDPNLLLQAARTYTFGLDPTAAADALTKLEELRDLTREEGYWLAGQIRIAGDSGAAMERYEALFAVDMEAGLTPDYSILEALGDLRADHRKDRAAFEAFTMIPETARSANLKLKIGRAAWKTRQLDIALAAVSAYTQEHPQDMNARLDSISIMTEMGQTEEAKAEAVSVFDQAQAYLEEKPDDAEYLLFAARAASLSENPNQAVVYLELLSQTRELTVPQQAWLAGQYRALGDKEKAIRLYEAAFSTDPDTFSTADLTALGDLRMDNGNATGALTAYQLIPEGERGPEINLKYARALSREDFRSARAVELYESYLQTHPDNMDIHLEAARFFVNAGNPDKSTDAYEKVVEVRGGKGLELEMARAYLAGNRFDQAEKWSRAALETDAANWQIQLTLAQSLHLQGKVHKADDIITQHKDEISKFPEGKEWLGLIAMSRDRHLAAFKLFSELVEDKTTAELRFWIWRGESAQKLGNYKEAKRSFKEAENFRDISDSGTEDLPSFEFEKKQAETNAKRIRDAGLSK